ncbi:hypothetical protein NMD1_02469 [Novosphingobium sp. MD-1]|nr:hypothetical protein NMD1_02469 [Novosphingobium sp. MD-1]
MFESHRYPTSKRCARQAYHACITAAKWPSTPFRVNLNMRNVQARITDFRAFQSLFACRVASGKQWACSRA